MKDLLADLEKALHAIEAAGGRASASVYLDEGAELPEGYRVYTELDAHVIYDHKDLKRRSMTIYIKRNQKEILAKRKIRLEAELAEVNSGLDN